MTGPLLLLQETGHPFLEISPHLHLLKTISHLSPTHLDQIQLPKHRLYLSPTHLDRIQFPMHRLYLPPMHLDRIQLSRHRLYLQGGLDLLLLYHLPLLTLMICQDFLTEIHPCQPCPLHHLSHLLHGLDHHLLHLQWTGHHHQ